MAGGGKRPGAGRPKGSINKRTAEKVAAIEASGMTPLDYLTSIYQDVGADKARRLDAAKAAAPYVHAKLSTIDAKIDAKLSVTEVAHRIIDSAPD